MDDTQTLNIESLRQLGSEWQKNDKHRIYFNDLEAWMGLDCSYYNSGNISGATLDGERISNSEARRIKGRICCSKIFWDFSDQKFHGKDINEDDFDSIVSAIRREWEKLGKYVAIDAAI